MRWYVIVCPEFVRRTPLWIVKELAQNERDEANRLRNLHKVLDKVFEKDGRACMPTVMLLLMGTEFLGPFLEFRHFPRCSSPVMQQQCWMSLCTRYTTALYAAAANTWPVMIVICRLDHQYASAHNLPCTCIPLFFQRDLLMWWRV